MDTKQMEQLFRTHRDAEKRRDFDGIMKTFTAELRFGDDRTREPQRRSGGGAVPAHVAYFSSVPRP